MNVLKFMRSSAILKYLLWLVILSFIIWIFAFYGGGGQTSDKGLGPDYIVKVGNKTLPPQALTLAMQFQRERIRSMLGEEYVEQFMKDAHKSIAGSLVDALILSYLAEDYGLEVSDAETADSILKAFKFTEPASQYEMMLKTRGVSAQEFESLWKTDLTRRKLSSFIASGFVLGDADLESRYRETNSKFKAKIVSIKSTNFSKEVGPVPESDVLAAFEKQKNALAIPEKRDVKYYLLSSSSVRAGMEIPENELKTYYESNRERFGEKPFEQVKGQVKSVMLFSDKSYEGKIKALLENAKADFGKAGNEKDITAMGEKYKIKLNTIDDLDRERPKPPFAGEEALLALTFDAKPNEWSGVVELAGSSVRFCVTEIKPPHPATFEEVKRDIMDNLRKEKLSEITKKAAFELKALAKDPAGLEKEAKNRQFQVQDSNELAIEDPIPMIGKNRNVALKVFDSSVNDISGPFETKDGFALAALLEKSPADMKKFQAEKVVFAEEQARKEAQNYLDDYVTRKKLELEAKGLISVNQEILKRYEPQTGS